MKETAFMADNEHHKPDNYIVYYDVVKNHKYRK